jgi:hydrogenase maturation protease
VDAWICEFSHLLSKNYGKCVVHLVSLGNSLKRDDGVGIYILNRLGKMLKNNLPPHVKIHTPRPSVEAIIHRIPSQDTVIFFDAVMTNNKPGTIIFTSLSKAKFGFFATHNIPVKILLQYRSMLNNSYLLGVVPYDLSLGEGLSPLVKTVADYIVDELYRIVRFEPHD